MAVSYSEFYAAQISSAMGLNHVPYGLSRWKVGLCSTCELFTSDDNLQDLNAYALTRMSSYYLPFLDVAKSVITDTQKAKLRKMAGFTFTKHSRYNLPAKRLKVIEKFLQHRKDELIALV